MREPLRMPPLARPARARILWRACPALVLLAFGPRPAPALRVSPQVVSVPVRRIEGRPYLSAEDLARLIGATRAWRSDVRRLVLTAAGHQIELMDENPFAAIDSRIVRLPAPPRTVEGELLVPAVLADMLPRDPALARLLYDAARDQVVVLPPAGVVRARELLLRENVTRLEFTADRSEEATLADRSRAHFRVRFSGYFAGTLPDSLPRAGLVRALRPIGTASGCAFELAVAAEAAGFRFEADPATGRVTVEFARMLLPGFEPFAPEGYELPRGTPLVVLDAGHGGADGGVESGGLIEKDLTLELARLLRQELEGRRIARVVLTRDDDRSLDPRQRAEAANHAHADLFLSLHFDGFPGARSRGATAWCPPAGRATWAAPADRFGRPVRGDRSPLRAVPGGRADRAGLPAFLPWREVAFRHAERSRALAEAVRSAFVLRDQGPVRVREVLAGPLVGVDAPGLMLDCATLTSPGDVERLSRRDGLRAIAVSLANAIAAYRRSD